jgi:GGDEF domain-containing protein
MEGTQQPTLRAPTLALRPLAVGSVIGMDPTSHRASEGPEGQSNVVAVSGTPLGGSGAAIPPRFERQLRGAARRRRGAEHPWVAVAKVNGVAEIRRQYGDPAAEEFLRGTASALRSSLRESDKLSPVGREEYGIVLDAPSGDDVLAGLERLIKNVRELAGRDHRWKGGSLSVGVTPMWTDEPTAILERARAALERAQRRGGGQVMMATNVR